MCSRLQPYVTQGATLCAPGCNPVPPGLQPYVTQAFELMQRENDQLRRRLHELEASGWYRVDGPVLTVHGPVLVLMIDGPAHAVQAWVLPKDV